MQSFVSWLPWASSNATRKITKQGLAEEQKAPSEVM